MWDQSTVLAAISNTFRIRKVGPFGALLFVAKSITQLSRLLDSCKGLLKRASGTSQDLVSAKKEKYVKSSAGCLQIHKSIMESTTCALLLDGHILRTTPYKATIPELVRSNYCQRLFFPKGSSAQKSPSKTACASVCSFGDQGSG